MGRVRECVEISIRGPFGRFFSPSTPPDQPGTTCHHDDKDSSASLMTGYGATETKECLQSVSASQRCLMGLKSPTHFDLSLLPFGSGDFTSADSQSSDSTQLFPVTHFSAHKEYLVRLLISPVVRLPAKCSADHKAKGWSIDLNENDIPSLGSASLALRVDPLNPLHQVRKPISTSHSRLVESLLPIKTTMTTSLTIYTAVVVGRGESRFQGRSQGKQARWLHLYRP